jgi:3-hydroxybutyryl-CoA dehydrogenase
MDKASPLPVVVVGAGLMGCGIAAGMLAHGRRSVLLVRDAARADAARQQTLELLAALGSASDDGATLSVQAMAAFDGWGDAALVIESVKEDLALKQSLFAWLDARVPAGVPIGSNSSSYPISRIAAGLAGRARMFGTHYFMPAHRVPLVEVVLGADSDPALGARVCALFAASGKTPVLVKRDIAGFLANRIQHALMREVLALIDSGIASPEDIDVAVRYSFGFRYAAIGPVLQKEISGWDSTAAAAREIYPTLSNATVPAACLERLVAEGKLGMKSGAGFFEWTPATAAAARSAYDERLAAALRLLE